MFSSHLKLTSITLVCLLSLSACTGGYWGNAATGSAVGGATGVVLGAIVGNIITNGNPAASALAGAGIGIPVGAVLGLALSSYDDQIQEDRRFTEYKRRQREIMRTDKKIDQLRDELRDQYPSGRPNRYLKERYHTDQTLGDYYR